MLMEVSILETLSMAWNKEKGSIFGLMEKFILVTLKTVICKAKAF